MKTPRKKVPHLWKPGQSGNPSGRPKILADVQALAREHTLDCIKALADIVKNTKGHPGARAAASQALLDRAYGKPSQTVNANVNILDKLSIDEQRSLEAFIGALSREQDDIAPGTETTH